MKWQVGSFYKNDRHFGIFKCVGRAGSEGYFKLIDEDNMKLHEEMKTSDDGSWDLVDSENIPQKYQFIDE